jgi:hypothetical protein
VAYGSDTDCAVDLPLRDAQVTGRKNLANALVRRLQTPRGALAEIEDDPDYGLDVRQLVGAGLTRAQVARWQAEIAAECAKDERVVSASVVLTFVREMQRITIEIEIMPVNESVPLTLVLAVAALTVEVMRIS